MNVQNRSLPLDVTQSFSTAVSVITTITLLGMLLDDMEVFYFIKSI